MPSAVRSSDSTTTIRVNDVIITRIDGASESTVISAISWIARSVRSGALAEIDADVLREGGVARELHRIAATVSKTDAAARLLASRRLACRPAE